MFTKLITTYNCSLSVAHVQNFAHVQLKKAGNLGAVRDADSITKSIPIALVSKGVVMFQLPTNVGGLSIYGCSLITSSISHATLQGNQ